MDCEIEDADMGMRMVQSLKIMKRHHGKS